MKETITIIKDLIVALKPYAEPRTQAMDNYPCHIGIFKDPMDCSRCKKAIFAHESIQKAEKFLKDMTKASH
jgi:hypothetical protein